MATKHHTKPSIQKPDEYKCHNPDSPTPTRWYVDLPGDNGQWYLALENNKWVFQPEQNGNNKFLLYQFEPSTKREGDVVAQIQGDMHNGNDKISIATTSERTLTALNLPNNLIENWVPPNPRFFIASYYPEDDDTMSGPTYPSGQYTLESLMHSGYFLAYNSRDNTPGATTIPVILVKNGDPNWGNRILTSTMW